MTVSISNISASWIDNTKTYTGIGLKVTSLNTTPLSYGASSKLIDLKVDGTSVFYVDTTGNLFAANLYVANASIDFSPVFIKTNAAFAVANAAYNNANIGFISANNYAGAMANSANAYALSIVTSDYVYVNTSVSAANNYAGAMANAANAYALSIVTSDYVYVNNSVASANAYAGAMANAANAYASSLSSGGLLGANGYTNVATVAANNWSNVYSNTVGVNANTYANVTFVKLTPSTSSQTIANDVVVTGNLTVGRSSQTLSVNSPAMVMFSGTVSIPSTNVSIFVNRGTYANSYLMWNENAKQWAMSSSNSSNMLFIASNTDIANVYSNTYNWANATFATLANVSTIFGKVNNTVQTGYTTISNGSVSLTTTSNVATLTISAGNVVNVVANTTNNTLIITQNPIIGAASNTNGISAISYDAYGRITAVTGAAGYFVNATALSATTGTFTSGVYAGPIIGTQAGRASCLTANTTASSSPFAARSGGSNTVFSILPWTSGVTYIGSGVYYDASTWVPASDSGTNALFVMSGGGTSWYASNGGLANWNLASGVALWNSSGTWTGTIAASSGSINGTTIPASSTLVTTAGATMTGMITGKTNTGGDVSASNDSGSLSVRGDSTNAASISFHRPGLFAINMGLDTDNIFKIGGWSDGASTYRLQLGGPGGTHTFNGTVSATAGSFSGYHTIDSSGAIVRTGGGNYGLRIYPGGGTSSTASILQFTNGAQNTQWGSLWYDGTQAGIGTDSAVPFLIRTNGTTRVTVDGSGNLTSASPIWAPVIYDLNDDNFYLDPASTSNLLTVKIADYRYGTISYISKAGAGCMMILQNGQLYTASGTSGGTGNQATGRGVNNTTPYWSLERFKAVSFPGETTSPIQVGTDGMQRSWALFANGNLYTWGLNVAGQCGTGNTTAVGLPVLSTTGVVAVYDGPSCSNRYPDGNRLIVKKTDGYLYGCGYNANGQLGLGNVTNPISSWTQMTSLGNSILNVWNMGATWGCTIVQKTDYTIWACGYNAYGQLGIGNATTPQNAFVNVTTAWGGGSGYVLKKVIGGFGGYSSADYGNGWVGMLLDNGTTTIYKVCGVNTNGECGNGANFTSPQLTPVTPNVGSGRIADVAAVGDGQGASYVLKEDGSLYTWGYNGYGQLGNGTTTNNYTPTVNATSVNTLLTNSCVCYVQGYVAVGFIKKSDGYMYGAGYNAYGQLGVGDTTNRSVFTRTVLPSDFNVSSLGWMATTYPTMVFLAQSTDGRFYAWGYNVQNAISTETTINLLTPTQISPFLGG